MNTMQALYRRGWTNDARDLDGDPSVPFGFFDPAYTADGWSEGIAWRVDGWQVEPNEDTDWSGLFTPTGSVIAHMIGDDRPFTFDPAELTPLSGADYCQDCGQVGCKWHTIEED